VKVKVLSIYDEPYKGSYRVPPAEQVESTLREWLKENPDAKIEHVAQTPLADLWVCPVSTDCLPLSHSTSSHSSFLVLSGAEMSQCGMPSVGVVEALDVLEDRSSGALAVRP
jgi:hypothetical protein